MCIWAKSKRFWAKAKRSYTARPYGRLTPSLLPYSLGDFHRVDFGKGKAEKGREGIFELHDSIENNVLS
jgi:hypothetical protein